ncbi:hypothetical protein M758_12G153600 [Ceratodon purpureus]|nr:hypothetical protein M758_12G153600 [Ceratodon purpureus]
MSYIIVQTTSIARSPTLHSYTKKYTTKKLYNPHVFIPYSKPSNIPPLFFKNANPKKLTAISTHLKAEFHSSISIPPHQIHKKIPNLTTPSITIYMSLHINVLPRKVTAHLHIHVQSHQKPS